MPISLPAFLRRKTQDAPKASASLTSPGWLSSWAAGSLSTYGDAVNEDNSLAIAAVYRCVTLVAGVIAALDLGIYTNSPTLGRIPVSNKITNLFTVTPFPGRQMTSYVWKESMVMNILLHGNHYSIIRFDGAGRIVAFEYCPPWLVTVMRDNVTQFNIYKVRWPNGRAEELVNQDKMIHIPGPGFDGFQGMSRIRQNARNTIALARSIEETIGKSYDNAMSPRMVIKTAPGMDTAAIDRLKNWTQVKFAGKENAGSTLFLDAGSEADALQINVVDLALIEAMKASVTQIAMIFGVPPVLLGSEQTTSWGSGIEQILLGWLQFGLNSELERIEAEFTSKVCTSGQYVLFDRDQLLAMNAQTAAQVASTEIACGLSTINEARIRKHRPTVEGGDTVLINSTNIPLSRALNPVPPTAPAQVGENNDSENTQAG